MDIPQALDGLKYILRDGFPSNSEWLQDWAREYPLAADSMIGTMHENGWRGTLSEFLATTPYKTVAERAKVRLEFLDDSDMPRISVRNRLEGLAVRGIGLGTYGWKYDSDIIHYALNHYISILDTAETYGFGRVEKRLGNSFDGDWPGCVIIATKVASNHMSYQSVQNAAERSEYMLGRIDLYQIHRPSNKVPMEVTLRSMIDLLDTKQIGNIGVCNFSIDQIVSAQSISDNSVVSVQIRYNLLDRVAERVLIPFCQEKRLQVIAYSPLGQDFKRIVRADAVGVLRKIAKSHNATMAQVALAFVMDTPGVTPIPRTNKLDHLVELLEAREIRFSAAEWAAIDDAFPIRY